MSVVLLKRLLAASALVIWIHVGWLIGSRNLRDSSSDESAATSAFELPLAPLAETASSVVQAPGLNIDSEDAQFESNLSMLIQEPPPRRSAFRPDFSSGFRTRNFRSNFFMLQAFKDAVNVSHRSTVQLVSDGEQLALGTIVDSDGWIITKASELDSDQRVDCILADQRSLKAEFVSTATDMDIALLHVQANGLPAVQWEYAIPDQGKWLATTDAQSGVPAAIGVVSTGPSKVPSVRAVMGVELAQDEVSSPSGAKVVHVLTGSGAYRGGLLADDVITSVNGTPTQSRVELLNALRDCKGGQFLALKVRRNDENLDLKIRLMDLPTELMDETELEVNGPISARATGFNRIFMHDTVLQPNQCGGPIFNLDGKAVGINIARAGRVATYALPADALRPTVDGLLQQAKLVSHRSSLPAPAELSAPAAPLATAP